MTGYIDVEIDENFMDKEKNDDESKEAVISSTEIDDEDEKSDDEFEDVQILNSVKKFQADHHENTCLIRDDLESIMVENKTEKYIHRKKGKGAVVSIAPGENKVTYF